MGTCSPVRISSPACFWDGEKYGADVLFVFLGRTLELPVLGWTGIRRVSFSVAFRGFNFQSQMDPGGTRECKRKLEKSNWNETSENVSRMRRSVWVSCILTGLPISLSLSAPSNTSWRLVLLHSFYSGAHQRISFVFLLGVWINWDRDYMRPCIIKVVLLVKASRLEQQ